MAKQLFENRVGRVCAPQTVDFLARPVNEPVGDEVVVKVVSSAICGSDMHIFKGLHPSVPLPVTIGHEFSGDVVAVGPDAEGIKVGDRVTVEPAIVCGKCDACLHGEYGYCQDINFTYRKGDGAMADYVTVRKQNIHHLPDDISYDAGALIEPMSVATHAVRRADIKMGQSVLVIGAGAIGLLVAALCRKCGATEVIVSDHSAHRLDMAMQLGATATVNASQGQDLDETIARLTGGRGVDHAFECVGLEVTFVQAMKALRKNGLATIIGIFENPNITIPAMRFITHEIRVQGAQGYCWDFPIAIRMAKEIDLSKLISHTFALDQLQTALETCFDRSANSIKVLVKP